MNREQWLSTRGRPIHKAEDISVGDYIAIPHMIPDDKTSIRIYQISRIEIKDTVKFKGFLPYPVAYLKREHCGIRIKNGEIYGHSYVNRPSDGAQIKDCFYPDREAVKKWGEHLWEYEGQPFVITDESLLNFAKLISAIQIPHLSFIVQNLDIDKIFSKIEDAQPEIEACNIAINNLMAKLDPFSRNKICTKQ